MTEIIYNSNKEEIFKLVADKISESIEKLLKTQDKVILAVPGGRSVASIFEQIKNELIDWEKVHLFMIDERRVPLDDDESNFKIAKEHIVDKLNLNPNNVHPYKVNEGISKYQSELEKQGGVYDIILLSSGEDGHVAALFPNHHSIKDSLEYFIEMDDSPKLPPKRMTSSKKLLERSKIGIILFVGEGKKQAYSNFKNSELNVEQCPAKLINSKPVSIVFFNYFFNFFRQFPFCILI